MKCDTCHEDKRITLEHGVKVNGNWCRWRICVDCELRERKEQDGRAVVAIEQAERAGV